jgi:hypothetical protein
MLMTWVIPRLCVKSLHVKRYENISGKFVTYLLLMGGVLSIVTISY